MVLLGLKTKSCGQMLHTWVLLKSIYVHAEIFLTVHHRMRSRLESTVGLEGLPVVGASSAWLLGQLKWLV